MAIPRVRARSLLWTTTRQVLRAGAARAKSSQLRLNCNFCGGAGAKSYRHAVGAGVSASNVQHVSSALAHKPFRQSATHATLLPASAPAPTLASTPAAQAQQVGMQSVTVRQGSPGFLVPVRTTRGAPQVPLSLSSTWVSLPGPDWGVPLQRRPTGPPMLPEEPPQAPSSTAPQKTTVHARASPIARRVYILPQCS
jgi:hypothetical protein